LNEELPPFSVRNKQGGAGFDVLAAQALAKRLGRPLAVQWYESKLDEDGSMPMRFYPMAAAIFLPAIRW
jgi:hypothetical protein